jgi:hypothetical protein
MTVCRSSLLLLAAAAHAQQHDSAEVGTSIAGQRVLGLLNINPPLTLAKCVALSLRSSARAAAPRAGCAGGGLTRELWLARRFKAKFGTVHKCVCSCRCPAPLAVRFRGVRSSSFVSALFVLRQSLCRCCRCRSSAG